VSKPSGRKADASGPELFIERTGQLRITDKSAEQRAIEKQRVECLGMTFESDEARRAYFLEKLREKLKDPEFRKIEGFPIGKDEDILALSDPPYYTACPNPFLADFVRCYGKPYEASVPYSREPFATDVSEGKTDPLYLAHSYHTKVPPNALVRYLLWYSQPGDVILDAYCGSGMTGVAGNLCADPPAPFRKVVEAEWGRISQETVPWGPRRIILNDLAPAAAFIAANYCQNQSPEDVRKEVTASLASVSSEFAWTYETKHNGWPAGERDPHRWMNRADARGKGAVAFFIWTEVLSCSHCGQEINLWKYALDPETASIKDSFPCPSCNASSKKLNLERRCETVWDDITKSKVTRNKFVPAFIVYEAGGKRFEKIPDETDLETLRQIDSLAAPGCAPVRLMMDEAGVWGNMHRAGYHQGVSHVHHFFPEFCTTIPIS
jgi:hypothetical protein